MGMVVNNNLAAANAYRNLSNNQTNLSKSLEKLSSGLRINRAADDAAGLASSEGMRSQINGLGVAANNAQDGINVVQTAEGGLNQTHAILQRLRDLSVQAANDSNNADSRAAITTEAKGLVDELGRIAGSTNFNGVKLLDGSRAGSNAMKFQVGADGGADSQISLDLKDASVAAIKTNLGSGSAGGSGTSFDIDLATVTTGAVTFKSTNGTEVTTVTTAALAAPKDTVNNKYASVEEYADALRADKAFSENFTVSVAKDSNGGGKSIVVTAKDGGTLKAADNDLGTQSVAGYSDGAEGSAAPVGIQFDTAANAQASVTLIDKQIQTVSTARAALGATQNRLEYAVQTINVSKENLTAAESRIRDVDMAEEMAKYTRSNILSQAGTAMLAQANQSTQGVLQLLR